MTSCKRTFAGAWFRKRGKTGRKAWRCFSTPTEATTAARTHSTIRWWPRRRPIWRGGSRPLRCGTATQPLSGRWQKWPMRILTGFCRNGSSGRPTKGWNTCMFTMTGTEPFGPALCRRRRSLRYTTRCIKRTSGRSSGITTSRCWKTAEKRRSAGWNGGQRRM